MKFRILPKVSGVRLKDVRYVPGDIIDLPESYMGETYLEIVPEPSITPTPVEEESVPSGTGASQEEATAPPPLEKPRRKRRKKDD